MLENVFGLMRWRQQHVGLRGWIYIFRKKHTRPVCVWAAALASGPPKSQRLGTENLVQKGLSGKSKYMFEFEIKMRVKTNHRKSKRVAWIVENPEAERPMKLLPRNCSTKNALCPTAPTEPRREYQIVLHVTLNHRSSQPGVSSLSNRKEGRKWRENTNQKAPKDFPDWKCSKKLQRRKTITTIQIHYNVEITVMKIWR